MVPPLVVGRYVVCGGVSLCVMCEPYAYACEPGGVL